ncbi:hypothetical protein [Streptomyces sp. NPDC048565]|uniref:hypothetical protein n=1 Tax=Streptomyces sp. NPDC048565 TaxID=3155266 RepID=UPI003435FB77
MANLLGLLGAALCTALAAAAAVGLLIRRRHKARQRQQPQAQAQAQQPQLVRAELDTLEDVSPPPLYSHEERENFEDSETLAEAVEPLSHEERVTWYEEQEGLAPGARLGDPWEGAPESWRYGASEPFQSSEVMTWEYEEQEALGPRVGPLEPWEGAPESYRYEERGAFEDSERETLEDADWGVLEPPAQAEERSRAHEHLAGFDVEALLGEATKRLLQDARRQRLSENTYDATALLAGMIERQQQANQPHLPSAFEHNPTRTELLKAIAHGPLSYNDASAAAPGSAQSLDHALAMLFIRLGPPPTPSETDNAPASNGDGGARQ